MTGFIKKRGVALGVLFMSGLVVCCAAFQFVVFSQLPPVALMEPEDDCSMYMTHPQFRWTEGESADRYEIQIAADSGFASILQSDSIPVPRYIPLEA